MLSSVAESLKETVVGETNGTNHEKNQSFGTFETRNAENQIQRMKVDFQDVLVTPVLQSSNGLNISLDSRDIISNELGMTSIEEVNRIELMTTTVTTLPSSTTSSSTDNHENPDEVIKKTEDIVTIQLKVGPTHFELLKLLGEGAFGKVVLVKNRLNHQLYAMKVISKELLRKKNNVMYMKSERDILTQLNHPFLVKLHYAFQSTKKLFLVMDFLGGGELFQLLTLRGAILQNEAQFYLAEMVLALEFLHQKRILHRDLKPENILLRYDGHVCITDFGLAKEFGDGVQMRTLCGTSEYMAPEMLSRSGYGVSVDWWSLGALTFEMLIGRAPFTAKTPKELDKKIMFEKLVVPSYLNASTHSLLKSLLDKDPTKRLGCARGNMFTVGGVTALKNHEFFKGIDWHALERLEVSPPIDLDQTLKNVRMKQARSGVEPPSEPKGDGRIPPEVTRFFNAAFTKRDITGSLVEDVVMTTTATPTCGPTACGTPPNETHDLYHDFEFTNGSYAFAPHEVDAVNAEIESKQAKLLKKLAAKKKKEEQAALDLEAKRIAAEAKAAEDKLAAEAAALVAAEKARQLALQKERQTKMAELRALHASYLADKAKLAEALAPTIKRLRAVRKKITEATDAQNRLNATGAKPNADQVVKFAKLPEFYKEEADLIVIEEEIMATCPSEFIVPDHLLDVEEEVFRPAPPPVERAVTAPVSTANPSSLTPASTVVTPESVVPGFPPQPIKESVPVVVPIRPQTTSPISAPAVTAIPPTTPKVAVVTPKEVTSTPPKSTGPVTWSSRMVGSSPNTPVVPISNAPSAPPAVPVAPAAVAAPIQTSSGPISWSARLGGSNVTTTTPTVVAKSVPAVVAQSAPEVVAQSAPPVKMTWASLARK